MATETEIDRIVFRMVAEGSSVQDEVNKTVKSVKGMEEAYRRATSVVKSLETAEESYASTQAALNAMFADGNISFGQRLAAAKKLQDELDRNSVAGKTRLAAEQREQALMREGEAITRSVMTTEERRKAKLDNLNMLFKEGKIGQETYNRAAADLVGPVQAVGEKSAAAEVKLYGTNRALNMISNSIRTMVNAKGPEQMLTSLGHVAHGIGYMFGTVGIAVGAVVGVEIALIEKAIKEFDAFGQSAKKGSEEAVSAFASGADKQVALSTAQASAFKGKMKEAGEGATSAFTRFWGSQVGTVMSSQEYFRKKVNQGVRDQIEIQKVLGEVSESNTGRMANAYAGVLDQTEKVNKSLEEMKYKSATLGAPEELRSGLIEIIKAQEKLDTLRNNPPRMAGEGGGFKITSKGAVSESKGDVFFDKRKYEEAVRSQRAEIGKAEDNLAKQQQEFGAGNILKLNEEIDKLKDSIRDVGLDTELAKAKRELKFLTENADVLGDKVVENIDKIKEKIDLLPKKGMADLLFKMRKEGEDAGVESHLKAAKDFIDKFGDELSKEQKRNLLDQAAATEEKLAFEKKYNDEMTAGLKGSEKAAWLRGQSLGKTMAETNELVKQAHIHDLRVGALGKLRDLQEEAAKFGKSEIGYMADQLEKTGKPENLKLAENLKLGEQAKAFRDLSKEVAAFNLEMAGATKAQIAYAKASDPVAAKQAYANSLMQEGLQITQANMTPAEKFNQTHRELSDLLAHNTISQETYNRAVGKAAQQLNGMREAIQGVAAGSAESFGKLLTYQDMLMGVKQLPKPIPLGAATGVGSAEEATRLGKPSVLDLILQELQKANGKQPGNWLLPGNLGGGG